MRDTWNCANEDFKGRSITFLGGNTPCPAREQRSGAVLILTEPTLIFLWAVVL